MVDELDGEVDGEFLRRMNAIAQQIAAGREGPYDLGMRLMGEMVDLYPDQYALAACWMWGFLTDGIDGPPHYAQGLSKPEFEDLMRQAAVEWLALDPTPKSCNGTSTVGVIGPSRSGRDSDLELCVA